MKEEEFWRVELPSYVCFPCAVPAAPATGVGIFFSCVSSSAYHSHLPWQQVLRLFLLLLLVAFVHSHIPAAAVPPATCTSSASSSQSVSSPPLPAVSLCSQSPLPSCSCAFGSSAYTLCSCISSHPHLLQSSLSSLPPKYYSSTAGAYSTSCPSSPFPWLLLSSSYSSLCPFPSISSASRHLSSPLEFSEKAMCVASFFFPSSSAKTNSPPSCLDRLLYTRAPSAVLASAGPSVPLSLVSSLKHHAAAPGAVSDHAAAAPSCPSGLPSASPAGGCRPWAASLSLAAAPAAGSVHTTATYMPAGLLRPPLHSLPSAAPSSTQTKGDVRSDASSSDCIAAAVAPFPLLWLLSYRSESPTAAPAAPSLSGSHVLPSSNAGRPRRRSQQQTSRAAHPAGPAATTAATAALPNSLSSLHKSAAGSPLNAFALSAAVESRQPPPFSYCPSLSFGVHPSTDPVSSSSSSSNVSNNPSSLSSSRGARSLKSSLHSSSIDGARCLSSSDTSACNRGGSGRWPSEGRSSDRGRHRGTGVADLGKSCCSSFSGTDYLQLSRLSSGSNTLCCESKTKFRISMRTGESRKCYRDSSSTADNGSNRESRRCSCSISLRVSPSSRNSSTFGSVSVGSRRSSGSASIVCCSSSRTRSSSGSSFDSDKDLRSGIFSRRRSSSVPGDCATDAAAATGGSGVATVETLETPAGKSSPGHICVSSVRKSVHTHAVEAAREAKLSQELGLPLEVEKPPKLPMSTDTRRAAAAVGTGTRPWWKASQREELLYGTCGRQAAAVQQPAGEQVVRAPAGVFQCRTSAALEAAQRGRRIQTATRAVPRGRATEEAAPTGGAVATEGVAADSKRDGGAAAATGGSRRKVAADEEAASKKGTTVVPSEDEAVAAAKRTSRAAAGSSTSTAADAVGVAAAEDSDHAGAEAIAYDSEAAVRAADADVHPLRRRPVAPRRGHAALAPTATIAAPAAAPPATSCSPAANVASCAPAAATPAAAPLAEDASSAGTPQQPERTFKEKRKSTLRRRSEYLRREKRFGAVAPPCVPAESERLDTQLLQSLQAPLCVRIHHNPDATLLLACNFDGNTTQKVFDLVLSHLRATLRVPGYRSGLAEAPVNLLLHYAGGRAAVQQRYLQALADLVLHKAKEEGAKLIGTPHLDGAQSNRDCLLLIERCAVAQDEEELLQRLAPGKDFCLAIRCDTLPTVRFKASYKGMQIRVPRPPYVRGLLFKKAEENLEKRHAVQVEYADQAERYARPGDAVDIEHSRRDESHTCIAVCGEMHLCTSHHDRSSTVTSSEGRAEATAGTATAPTHKRAGCTDISRRKRATESKWQKVRAARGGATTAATADGGEEEWLFCDVEPVRTQVVRGWFETTAGTRGDEIPLHLIRGNVSVILDPDCNPEGSAELIDGLMSIRRGEVREVSVPLPFSVEEMLPFVASVGSRGRKQQHPKQLLQGEMQLEDAAAAAASWRGRISVTGVLEQPHNAFAAAPGAAAAEGEGAAAAAQVATAAAAGAAAAGLFTDDATQQQQPVIDQAEERLVQTILHVRCLAVKRCIPKKLDDAFYQSLCKETRDQVKEKLETHGEALVEAASLRARRGAVAAALEDITTLEAPETLVEQQARLTFQQHLRSKAMEGEDTRGLDTEENYEQWKQENLRAVLRILKTAFTIKAILKQEKLEVDKQQLLQFVEETMMKYPNQDPDLVTERALNLMESQLVYDFVAAHANITYYIEERPLEATALHPGAEGDLSYGLKAYPPGADIERYKTKQTELLEENQKLHKLSSKFYIDQDKYKRPPML